MTRWDLGALGLLAAGTWLLLVDRRWFRRRRLSERLRGHLPGRDDRAPAGPPRTAAEVASRGLERLLSAAGAATDADVRLRLAGRAESAHGFRLRQVTLAVVGTLGGVGLAVATGAGSVAAVALVVGCAVTGVGSAEAWLTAEVERRRRRVERELPVVTEQLGMLLGAGASVPAALARVASRGSGVVAEELDGVVRRIRHGLGDTEALSEWAAAARSSGVSRLVAVLSLHQEARDLGALLGEEADQMRAVAHRRQLEAIERRAQLVWVPVTVATLVPGLVLLAVPFIEAMRRVAGT